MKTSEGLVKDWRRRSEGVNESQSKFFKGTWHISQIQSDASLLARLRPYSYEKIIYPQNRVRQHKISAEDDTRYKQGHVRDYNNQNQIDKQLKVSRIFH
jgi:hypothetical protein